ncbi:MAG: hypothetical protein M5U19_19820 [Microthrixaceae bacterium]|nr:hypothetical protein [Microthrixaceae bacterium]
MDDEPPTTVEEPHAGQGVDGGSSGGLDALRALGEPTRRALYDHVVAVGDWVGRDAAADAVGIERPNAAHHLDRLAADGLLEVDYRRISGRRGPGAGRPAKLYRRALTEIGVTLPPATTSSPRGCSPRRSTCRDVTVCTSATPWIAQPGSRAGASLM